MGKEKKRKQPPSDAAPPQGDEGEGRRERKGKKPKKDKAEAILPSQIKNKDKRSELHAKLKREKKAEKRKLARERSQAIRRAEELGEQPPEREVPRTIENTREPDETVCRPDDQELFAGNDADEFNAVLKQHIIPKVLITTCRFNSGRGPAFIEELMQVIPNSQYVKRGTYELKKIVDYAKNRDFTSLIVVHTNRREPDALLIIGLPDGPTAHLKLSKLVLRKDIKNHGNPTSHKPELVLNNFATRLGHRVGRMIQSLFPQDPNFRGRRVVTFHNQRDYIFFRHHRYIFETKESKVASKDKKAKTSGSKSQPEKQVICRLQVQQQQQQHSLLSPSGMWSSLYSEAAHPATWDLRHEKRGVRVGSQGGHGYKQEKILLVMEPGDTDAQTGGVVLSSLSSFCREDALHVESIKKIDVTDFDAC